jgi:Potato inhibitor I family
MMAEKRNVAPTIVGSKTDDRPSKRDTDEKSFKLFSVSSNRRVWVISFVVFTMLIAVISLAIGLGDRIKSGKSSSKSENVSKLSWPELVGMDAENASAWMKANYPEYNVYVVNYDEYVTEDFDAKRVRIYKAPNGTVYIVPKIGR